MENQQNSSDEIRITRPVGSYTEVDGNLIKLALQGEFDVIAHGCNCHCVMGAGIAPQMAHHFLCDHYGMESSLHKGNFNKLGNIDYGCYHLSPDKNRIILYTSGKSNYKWEHQGYTLHYAVNCYTQFGFGSNHTDGSPIPLNYAALELCLMKINNKFRGKTIGLPQIGCGLAGGDWNIVRDMIKKCLADCFVTVVIYKPEEHVSKNSGVEESEDSAGKAADENSN